MNSLRKFFNRTLSRVKTSFWMKQWLIYRTGFSSLNKGLKLCKESIKNWLSICNWRLMSSALSKKQCLMVLNKSYNKFRLTNYHRLWKSFKQNRCLVRVQSMRLKSKKILDWIVVNTSSCKTKQGSTTALTKTSTNQSPKRALSQNPSQSTKEERQGKQTTNQTHSGWNFCRANQHPAWRTWSTQQMKDSNFQSW